MRCSFPRRRTRKPNCQLPTLLAVYAVRSARSAVTRTTVATSTDPNGITTTVPGRAARTLASSQGGPARHRLTECVKLSPTPTARHRLPRSGHGIRGYPDLRFELHVVIRSKTGPLNIRPASLPPEAARLTRAFRSSPCRSSTRPFSPTSSVLLLTRLLRAAEPEEGPEGEDEDQCEPDGVGREDACRLAGEEAPGGVEYGGKRVQAGDG